MLLPRFLDLRGTTLAAVLAEILVVEEAVAVLVEAAALVLAPAVPASCGSSPPRSDSSREVPPLRCSSSPATPVAAAVQRSTSRMGVAPTLPSPLKASLGFGSEGVAA